MGLFSRNKTQSSGSSKQGETKKLNNSLGDEKQISKLIVSSIDDAVVLIDSVNVIKIFNPSAEKLTGWKQDEAIGLDYHTVFKIVDEQDKELPDTKNPFYKVFASKQISRESKSTIVGKNNVKVAVDMSVSPLINEDGLITGAVGVLRDVNQQRQEEKQRADFISTASHEMRTPVAAIEGYLALAMNDKVCDIDEKARGFLDKAHSSTSHLGKLFQDLLTSAKAEDGRLTSHPVLTDMNEFIEGLVEDLKFSAEKKGLGIELLRASPNGKNVNPLLYANVDPDRIS